MPLIVIRLFPEDGPVTGAEFEAYLTGLSIRAVDLATTAGEAQVGDPATHVPLPDPTQPHLPDPTTTIVQHVAFVFPDFVLQAAATAVLEVAPPHPPAGRDEHDGLDLRLEITRGTGEVLHHRLHVNVPQAPGAMPADPSVFPGLEPTSLYVPLPPPLAQVEPGDAHVALPEDGSPPAFDDLLGAVAVVLGDDPGAPVTIGALTPTQAVHVAREIVWNRDFRPLPGPAGADLGRLFTAPSDSDADAARGQLVGELTAHHATGEADADRLTAYVVALAAAVDAEARTRAATEAALTFPVLPGATATGERHRTARVVLTGLPSTARFTVPARYFYALGASLPVAYDADQRYRSALLADTERLRAALTQARDDGVIDEVPGPVPAGVPAGTPPVPDAPPVGIAAAVRRLRALGDTGGAAASLPATGDVLPLVQGWLAVAADDVDAAFWDGVTGTHPGGHLDLVLCALTRGYVVPPPTNEALGSRLRARTGVADTPALAALDEVDWEHALRADPAWPANLPDFTSPGSPDERVAAFLDEVRSFFALAVFVPPPDLAVPDAAPVLRTPDGDLLSRFVAAYLARAGAPFEFGGAWDEGHRRGAVTDAAVLDGDPDAERWLDAAVIAADELARVVDPLPAPLRFSVTEALYARGFTSRAQVAALTRTQLRDALVGSVGWDVADLLGTSAGGPAPDPPVAEPHPVPVNPDGCLTVCLPPTHLSAAGPVAYLRDLLDLPLGAGCVDGPSPADERTLGELVTDRRGPLGDLAVSAANLSTPLPVIDLVNESLEALAANPGTGTGAVHDTASDEVDGHVLAGAPAGTGPDGAYHHDAATLLGALPEHSSPAVPPAAHAAYEALRTDVSHPAVPYLQDLDVSRSHLQAMGTCRYDVVRAFRRDVTELVPDQPLEPAEFRRHLWRYPLRLDVALEYLCLSPTEHDLLTGAGREQGVPLHQWFGFVEERVGRLRWIDVVVRVPELLRRTGLTWCDLVDLQRSGLVPFRARRTPRADEDPRTVPVPATHGRSRRRTEEEVRPDEERPRPDEERPRPDEERPRPDDERPDPDDERPDPDDERPDPDEERPTPDEPPDDRQDLPECEPCHPDEWEVDLGRAPQHVLRRLAVAARLWRRLREVCDGGWTAADLADADEVLSLFAHDGALDPDAVRHLAALQVLRAELGVPLRDPSAEATGTGTARTPLLALWAGPADPHRPWAVEALLDGVRRHALRCFRCRPRAPQFLEVLAENLDALSVLVGFDPEAPGRRWDDRPTHTLRLAEVLAKLYASDLGVGELLFLVTTAEHLQGDDPFPLPSPNESHDDPLELPDDSGPSSLWTLRERLLAAEPDADEADRLDWTGVDAALRSRFGYDPGAGDPLRTLGRRFFPSALEEAGIAVAPDERRWEVALPGSPPLMWNTPAQGPFRYVDDTLTATLPLVPSAVLDKLARVRRLTAAERPAVRELLAGPAADLAPFAFLFESLDDAQVHLVEEPDESRRWAWFRRAVARTLARCDVLAEHLAAHVHAATGVDREGTADVARLLLATLHGDENAATAPWEDDGGAAPALTWSRPTGGAYAALLSLMGTGLLGELRVPATDGVVWRELRGPLDAFGTGQNAANAPVPGVIPALDLTATAAQGALVGIRNGFAMSAGSGDALGGAQGWSVRWSGALLVEAQGRYDLHLDASPVDLPDGPGSHPVRRWRVVLRRGQRTWVLLAKDWPGCPEAPECDASIDLLRGTYDLVVELEQDQPPLAEPDDVLAATAGVRLSYAGPDTDGDLVPLPRTRLYRQRQDAPLDAGIDDLTPNERRSLADRYTGSLRDVRRTYQRAFKALLLAHRLALSARPVSDDRQSELGYLLRHRANFSGATARRDGAAVVVHLADLDPDLLPVADPYESPDPADDLRAGPTAHRSAALADWWERLFDHTVVRAAAGGSPEAPTWLTYHESAENHPDPPADLLRHVGVDLRRTPLVLRYQLGAATVDLTSDDLMDDRWVVRVWHADAVLRRLLRCFAVADVRAARPALWAADRPGLPADGTSGNANLVRFVADGYLERGAPRRYADLAALDDGLRARARTALLGHLTSLDRVQLPWGEPVREPRQLSDLLLLDVTAGPAERASRVHHAISAVHAWVGRARLGLEPGAVLSPGFLALWDAVYGTYRSWEVCARREAYRENVVDVDVVAEAQRSEAFRFLEDQLRRTTLTRAAPGGMVRWTAPPGPEHPALALLQVRDPSVLDRVEPRGHGLGLLGTPDRHARPSWVAALGATAPRVPDRPDDDNPNDGPDDDRPDDDRPDDGVVGADGPGVVPRDRDEGGDGPADPWWVEAPVRLGDRFLRVAAAGEPAAAATPARLLPGPEPSSCCACGCTHAPVVDEYWFWLLDSERYDRVRQDSGWAWHDDAELPALLAWAGSAHVRLAWCRVHHGEMGPVNVSEGTVRVDGPARLVLVGRWEDSLTFSVENGLPPAPVGYPAAPLPGFRYDLAPDAVVALPLVPAAPAAGPATGPLHPGGLDAYPYYLLHAPGAPLVPPDAYAPALTVAAALRAHCRPDAALGWYALAFDPLHDDASWLRCTRHRDVGSSAAPTDRWCCTDSTEADEDDVRRRAVTLHVAETLLEWADRLMGASTTPESLAQARVVLDALERMLGARPRVVVEPGGPEAHGTVAGFVPHPLPPNPRLLSVYDRTADRLALVRECLDAERRLPAGHRETDDPYLGGSSLLEGWRERPGTAAGCPADACVPASPYRFTFLAARAKELSGQVRALGAALLAAFEAGDAQALVELRADHERALQARAVAVRQHLWRDADWQVQALLKTKEIAQANRRYYAGLVEAGLNRGENDYLALTEQAVAAYGTSIPLEAVGQALGFIPDIWLGVAGLGPLNANQLPLGTKLAGVFATAARIAGTVGTIANITASERLTEAGWDRREEEWRHQVRVLDVEIEQVERQILGAERRRDAALHELDDQHLRLEQAVEVDRLVGQKLTGHALYLWLQKETAALYRRSYDLARRAAWQAQRASNLERGHLAEDVLDGPLWDDLHEGLLAGERLDLALRTMEQAYLDGHAREYELVKHVSLRLAQPMELLRLKATGRCEIELPEWAFDQDHPGHYMRRLRNVSLTVPAVAGPYTGVHARLTLLSTTTRVLPYLVRPPAQCCVPAAEDPCPPCDPCPSGTPCDHAPSQPCRCDGCGCGGCGCCPHEEPPGDGYTLRPEDPRAVREYAAREAIATSTGDSDSGLFQLDFRDERYLPFEYHGAVSRWLLELPQESNAFDLDTVSDVVLHVGYTAREGGSLLRAAAGRAARGHLPGDGVRLLDVEHDLPDLWNALQAGARSVELRLPRVMFPFRLTRQELLVREVQLFLEGPCAVPSRHHALRFRPPVAEGCAPRPDEFDEITCVAGRQWPELFHGVLPDLDLGPLTDAAPVLGTLELPDTLTRVCRLWLVLRYATTGCETPRCGEETRHDL